MRFLQMRLPVILSGIFLVISGNLFAQEKKDSTQLRKAFENIRGSKMTKRVAESITRTPPPEDETPQKSEEIFMLYEGKIIRKIIINPITFERNVTDTTHKISNTVARVGNALHNNSKHWMLKDLLFFYENKPLEPYKLADNERFLRDQNFIKDARIYVHELDHTNDSVDVEVVTRDVFSVGGSFNPRGPTRTRFRIYDTNLAGWGQRVQFTGFVDTDRSPAFGYDVVYSKNSIAGSLINATLGYTQLDNSSSYGNENEIAYYIRLDRPLVSPYTRVAGGLEISRNWSQNVYQYPDSSFRKYNYRVHDLWIGYNLPGLSEGRNRFFVGARGFDQHYIRHPEQPVEQLNPVYNNRQYLLGKITYFRQDYYKTRYIYGFGRTEDVPYGQTASFLAGVERQFGNHRTYFGAELEKTIAHRRGNFYTLGLRMGSFRDNGEFEDATILASLDFYSKLVRLKNYRLRQSFNLNVTKVYNQVAAFPLDINNEFGLQNFRADSLFGNKRMNAGFETILFTPLKFLGFNFAGFVYGQLSWIAEKDQKLWDRTPYYGVGGGVRTRNENLVFGTIELRFVFFPRVIDNITQFKVSVSTNLRVRYTGNFVRAPAFVSYN
jgi:hypothetical protein